MHFFTGLCCGGIFAPLYCEMLPKTYGCCSHETTFVPLFNNVRHQYECHPSAIKIKFSTGPSSSHHKDKHRHSQRRWFTHSFICISHKSISLHCIASKQIKNESSIHTVSCKGAFCTVWVVFTVYLHAICYRPGALQAALIHGKDSLLRRRKAEARRRDSVLSEGRHQSR